MELVHEFEKLDIKTNETKYSCVLDDSLLGPWARLSLCKSDAGLYSVGDYVKVSNRSRNTSGIFRVKNATFSAALNSISISKTSASLFKFELSELVFVDLFVPLKVSPAPFIFSSCTDPSFAGLVRCHEFLEDYDVDKIARFARIDQASSDLWQVTQNTKFIFPTDNTDYKCTKGANRVWYFNSKISSSNTLAQNINKVYILPEDSIIDIEGKITNLIDRNSSIEVFDCSGRNRDSEFLRLIIKHDFATHDLSFGKAEENKTSSNRMDSWSKIGGYEKLVSEIRSHVETLLKNNYDSDSGLSLAVPKGILLYGPPGCSKTMIARAIASCMNIEFISVKGPEIFSKWVGDSEKAISDVFSKARKISPCVIFFDEFDSLGSSRSSEQKSAVESRVVAQLLSEIDGLSGGSKIIVVAATNRPDVIDPALLRPGRFDLHFHVPLPEPESRRKIIEMNLAGSELVENNELISKLVELSDGCSGAEVANGCRALMISLIKNGAISFNLDTTLFTR